jgi:uncharacterized protein
MTTVWHDGLLEVEWDEGKRSANLIKHGIDFADACQIFRGWTDEREDSRWDYGERRMLAYGESDGRVLLVVYTWRAGRRRLISARRAGADERKTYYARHPG